MLTPSLSRPAAPQASSHTLPLNLKRLIADAATLRLTTKRLVLRRMTAKDRETAIAHELDHGIMRWIRDPLPAKDVAQRVCWVVAAAGTVKDVGVGRVGAHAKAAAGLVAQARCGRLARRWGGAGTPRRSQRRAQRALSGAHSERLCR